LGPVPKGRRLFLKEGVFNRPFPITWAFSKAGFETPKLLSHLGTSYLAIGDFGKAETIFEDIINHRPDKLLALKVTGQYLHNFWSILKRPFNLYQTLLQDQPNNISARILLARVLTWSGRFEEAIVEYKKALGEKK